MIENRLPEAPNVKNGLPEGQELGTNKFFERRLILKVLSFPPSMRTVTVFAVSLRSRSSPSKVLEPSALVHVRAARGPWPIRAREAANSNIFGFIRIVETEFTLERSVTGQEKMSIF